MIRQVLAQLLKVLQQVPYLASKNMYRVANHFLHMDQKKAEQFCQVLQEAKMNIAYCSTCFVWQEKSRPCTFCDATKRDQALVCVVETWQELLAIEKTGGYTGVYHVLGGAICPLEGVGPENLHYCSSDCAGGTIGNSRNYFSNESNA